VYSPPVRSALWPVLLLAALGGGAAGGGDADPVADRLDHLRRHLCAHPAAGAEDAYKLLHQSVFGPAHLIPDRAAAAAYLEQEWAAMGPTLADEPLLEPLADNPPLVRVNLRPFRDAGGDRDLLVDALVTTANRVHGDPLTFAACLERAIAVLEELRGEVAGHDLDALARRATVEGYPAVHHSPPYQEAYRPAYRVVLRSLLESSKPSS
jgi:hypothetical protein